MKCRIVRGAARVGGSCVELEHGGRRLLIDLGDPLRGEEPLPDVRGLREPADDLLGVVASHSHADHWGKLRQARAEVPVFASEATAALWEVARVYARAEPPPQTDVRRFRPGEPFEAGPFRLTPLPVDHSAADAHALLIEAGGRTLLYTGDFRDEGTRPNANAALFAAAADADVLLCEGTTVGRTGHSESAASEAEVAERLAAVCRETEGLVMLWASGQNLSRLSSAATAAAEAGRRLVIDVYAAEAARACDRPDLKPDADRIGVYLPAGQKARVVSLGEQTVHDRVKSYRRPVRIFPEELKAAALRTVLLTRPSMLAELAELDCLAGGAWVTSIWSGYLAQYPDLEQRLQDAGVSMHVIHSSGHASEAALRRLIESSGSAVVVPIHTDRPDLVAGLSDRVVRKPDGEWWEV